MIDHIQRDLPASLTGADPLEIAWDRLGVPRQRLVLRMLVGRIVLHPVPPGPPPRRSGRPAQDGDRPVADRVIRAA
jgi:hypothetical protein